MDTNTLKDLIHQVIFDACEYQLQALLLWQPKANQNPAIPRVRVRV